MLIDKAACFLPRSIRAELEAMPREILSHAEELRLRAGFSPSLVSLGRELCFAKTRLCQAELESVLEKATNASVHSVQSSMAEGYLSAEGGIRIGVCGTAIVKDGKTCGIRELSSLAIRLPHECPGCADELLSRLMSEGFSDTLIISAPGGGKTTLLRELIRRLSDMGRRVSVADERGELAAVQNGVAQFDVGRHTDIISGGAKSETAMIMLRCMNPEIIAMDEISKPEDMEAVFTVWGCGVKLLATAHAGSLDEFKSRSINRKLFEHGAFKYCILIENRQGERLYTVDRL